ncbi:hypothetical protein JCM3770_005474 [Rhodotorula araucariae]
MLSSDAEADSFFAAHNPDRSAARVPSNKRRKTIRPSSSESDDDDNPQGASSDLEILDSSSARKSAARRKTTAKAAAPRPLARRNDRTAVTLSSSSRSDSDSGSGVDHPSGRRRRRRRREDGLADLPSATQLEEGGAVLRQLARAQGWNGSSPPRRAKQREEQVRREEDLAASRHLARHSDGDDGDAQSDASNAATRERRRKSASTEQTTVSDRSSSASKAKTAVAAAAAAAAVTRRKSATAGGAAPARKKRHSPPSRSESPQLEPLGGAPALPESFWGVEAQPAKRHGTAANRREVGAASKALRAMSEQRATLVLGDDDDDEIAPASSSSPEAGPSKYETVAARKKRQQEESLAQLKAKRAKAKQATLPLHPAPHRSTPRASSSKSKAEAVEGLERCLVCTAQVTAAELQSHTNACFNAGNPLEWSDTQQEQQAATPPPPPPPPPVAAPVRSRGSAFRPAGAALSAAAATGGSAARSRAAAKAAPAAAGADDLAATLFPSQSPRAQRPQALASMSKGRGKGKGKATLVPDCDEPGRGRAPQDGAEDDLAGYIDDGELAAWDEVDATLHKKMTVTGVVDLVDEDDDDDDVIVAGPSRPRAAVAGVAAAARKGGAVNTARVPGPPPDGSSPPRGSIYISTMSRAFKEGYERMYARVPPKRPRSTTARGSGGGEGNDDDYADVSDSDARAIDALAPPTKSKGRAAGGGGGGAAPSLLKNPEQLKASLEAHNASFDELLKHVPAKYYIRADSDDEDVVPKVPQGKLTKAQKKALRKAKHDETVRAAKNEAKREARLARYDPDEPKTIAEIQAAKLSAAAKGKKRAADADDDDESSDGEMAGASEGEWAEADEAGDSPNETDFADSDDEDGELLQLDAAGVLKGRTATPGDGPAPSITELKEKLQRRIAEIQAKKGGAAGKGTAAAKKAAAGESEDGDSEDDDEEEGAEGAVRSKDDLLAERRRRAALRDNRRKKMKERRLQEKSDGAKKRANEPSNGRKGGGKANAPNAPQGDDERPRKKVKGDAGDSSLVPYDAAAVTSASTSKSDPTSLAFSNLDFATNSERAADAGLAPKQLKKLQAAAGTLKKNRHDLPKDANKALEILQRRKERLDALEPEKREKKEDKERWEKVLLKAEGGKVRDDETRLKKMAKRQEREKRKSAKAWTDRKATVEKTISDKVAKRNANLAARKQQAKDKKAGVKAKSKGTGKKVSSSSGKARSKGRPGFEGGGRKKK